LGYLDRLLRTKISKGSISGTVHWTVRGRVALGDRGMSGQPVARKDHILEFGNGAALGWVHFKYPAENGMAL